ncbi:alpha/beta fold hydrolase [Ideonella sp. A 288]|uniref:alpha/beta fold hydrolase n=1 Tax=Ideonella sp. A 288 TaxID=1962181 RepID=UPI001186FA55|nr:alpha/beta hydrolase [Ideonella sp. A 288]
MPLDPASGVFYDVQGHGQPLLIGLPLMASFTELFGSEMQPVLDGYLNRLTDRYRVLRVDYPSIGGSRDIAPEALTADRVCADLLAVASAAGFDRFVYWGYSWGAAVGLQLAARTDRLTALVLGGWPPLGAPYAGILQATRLKQADPEPSSLKVLRSKGQYRQWETYYASMLNWPEAEAESVARIACPKMAFFGGEGDLIEAGIPIRIASIIREHRVQLEEQGWTVHEIAGQGHGVCMVPELAVPPVRSFLDSVLT